MNNDLLEAAIRAIEGLADQQAMPDDSYVPTLERLKAKLASRRRPPEPVPTMKPPKTLREWVGLRCRLRRDIKTGVMIAPAGTIVVVDSASVGLHCSSEACPHCKLRFLVRKLRPSDLEPLERVGPPDPPSRGKHAPQRPRWYSQ